LLHEQVLPREAVALGSTAGLVMGGDLLAEYANETKMAKSRRFNAATALVMQLSSPGPASRDGVD
jgi:hypothetical protein